MSPVIARIWMSAALVALMGASVVPSAQAQLGIDLFARFEFDELEFVFYPEGLEKTAAAPEDDADGSAFRIRVHNVSFEDAEAVKLRSCIDGGECPYPVPGGDGEGNVTQPEIDAFAQFFMRNALLIQEVQQLFALVKNNLTVDGVGSAQPRVSDLAIRNAQGPVNSTQPVWLDATVEARYDNDRSADSHDVLAHGLKASRYDAAYGKIVWRTNPGAAWAFTVTAAPPAGAFRADVGSAWSTNQTDFEERSENGLSMTFKRAGKDDQAGSSAPGPETFVSALAILAVAAALIRRRR